MIELIEQHSILLFSSIIILGLVLGSFLNVVIYRLPLMLQKAWQKEYEEVLRESEHVETIPTDEKTFDFVFHGHIALTANTIWAC